ncbi:unnamed protein product, partial [Rotaria magnacalcarata]
SRMIFSVLYRKQASAWLTELSNKIQDNQHKQLNRFFPSTVFALYIKRKYFVSFGPICTNNNNNNNNDDQQSDEKLTFSAWIDLLFDGTIRDPITVTEWPIKFH